MKEFVEKYKDADNHITSIYQEAQMVQKYMYIPITSIISWELCQCDNSWENKIDAFKLT